MLGFCWASGTCEFYNIHQYHHICCHYFFKWPFFGDSITTSIRWLGNSPQLTDALFFSHEFSFCVSLCIVAIPIQCIFISPEIFYFLSVWVLFGCFLYRSCLYLTHSCSFLNTWNPNKIAVLMGYPPINSIIYVNFGSVLIYWLFFLLGVVFSSSFAWLIIFTCVPDNVGISLLGVGCFCIPVAVPPLCLDQWEVAWQQLGPFGPRFWVICCVTSPAVSHFHSRWSE